jgi:hypothetical protein
LIIKLKNKINQPSSNGQWALTTLILSILCLLVIGCESAPNKSQPAISPNNYVDSTEYFAERKGSVSLRATFSKKNSKMGSGYKFQFRTISPRPTFLNSISVVAGGKRIFLDEGQIVLPSQKGVTLELSLEDSLFIGTFPSALLQFKQNNASEIFTIELHQLKEFSPR